MQRIFFLGLILLSILSGGWTQVVHAQTALQISPFRFDIAAQPGDTKLDSIEITNNSNEPQTLQLSVEDFYAGDEFGKPAFRTSTNPSDTFSVSTWLTPEQTTVQLPPRSSKTINFALRIPANAEPGGHYATLFFTPPKDQSGQVAVQGRIGALLLIDVAGEVRKEATLQQFGTYHPEVDFVANQHTNTQWIYENLPVHFAVRIQNAGTTHTRPSGTIALYDIWGKQLQHIGITQIVNNEGVLLQQKQSDTLAINPEMGVILPNSYRTFRAIGWDGYVYERSNPETGKIELIRERPWILFGPYRAVLTLQLGEETITEEITFWIIPWKLLGSSIAITIMLIITLRFALRKYHQYTERRLRTTISS